MKSGFKAFLVLAFLLSTTAPMALAEEMTEDVKVEAAAEIQKAMPEEPAVAPAESLVEPTPSIELAEGSVSAIDLEAEQATLTLKGADGAETTLYLDYETTVVMKGEEELILEDIQVGQNVKVRHAESDGKKVAKQIDIV